MARNVEIDEQAVWKAAAVASERAVDAALFAGEQYWLTHARVDTGHMAVSAEGVKRLAANGLTQGELVIGTEDATHTEYGHYQEYGTRYIRGMHLSADIARVMEEAAEAAGRAVRGR